MTIRPFFKPRLVKSIDPCPHGKMLREPCEFCDPLDEVDRAEIELLKRGSFNA